MLTAHLFALLLSTQAVTMAAPVGPSPNSQTTSAGRSNLEDVGLGPTWAAIKAKLPKTQEEADALEWPDVWRFVQGTLRETGFKGGDGAQAVTGPNGGIRPFGWPMTFEKYLVYTWDFQLGHCSVGFWKSRGKCVNGEWRYTHVHTTISFDPRDVSDITVNYTGRSTTSTVYRADDFDTVEINCDSKDLLEKTDEGTNYIFVDPDWLVNPNVTPEWKIDTGRYRFELSEQHLSTVEVPLMGTDKASLHGFAYLLARIVNENGGSGVKVLN